MLDYQRISSLLDLKEIWPRLTNTFTPIEERVAPVMPLLVEVLRGASFTVCTESGEKQTYQLLDESDALITNETMHISAKVSNYVFFRRMLWEEAAFGKNPSYRRGDMLEKIIRQVQ